MEVRGGVDRLVYNVSTTTSTGTGRSISYLERAAPWRNKARGWGHHPSTPLSTSFIFQLFISLVHLLSAAIPQYSHFLVAKTWLQNLLLLLSSLNWPFDNCQAKDIFQTVPQIWYCELRWWNDCPPLFCSPKEIIMWGANNVFAYTFAIFWSYLFVVVPKWLVLVPAGSTRPWLGEDNAFAGGRRSVCNWQ